MKVKFSHFSIRTTLLVIISVLNVLIAVLVGSGVFRSWGNLDDIRRIKDVSLTVTLLYNAEMHISMERGLTMATLNVSPKRAETLKADLIANRRDADERIDLALARIENDKDERINAALNKIAATRENVRKMRERLNNTPIPIPPDIKKEESDLAFVTLTSEADDIRNLITSLNEPILDINPIVAKQIYFKHFIWEITEYAGREYAQISRLIAENRIPDPDLQRDLFSWKDKTEYAWEISIMFAKDSGLEENMASHIEEAKAHYFITFEQIKDMFYETGDKRIVPPYPIDLEIWLEMAPQAVETLMDLKDMALQQTQDYIENLEADARQAIMANIVMFLCAIALSLYSWWIILNRVIKPVNRMVNSLYSEAHVMLPAPTSRHLTEQDEIGKLSAVLDVFRDYSRTIENTSRDLEQQKNYLKAVLETILDAIIAIDKRGIIRMVNPAVIRMFGYKEEELLGQNVKILMPHFYARDHDKFLERYLETGMANVIGKGREVEAMRRDGSVFPVDLSITEMKNNGEHMFVGMLRDITERKQSETQLLEYTLQLKRSNQELDDFVYIVSHDLKEPVRGLYSYSQFLMEDYADKLDEEGKSKLHTLQKLSIRMEELIDTLLYYSRLGKSELAFKETDIAEVVQKILDLLHPTLSGENITLEVGSMPSIVCDSARVGEIFRNLIVNAIKYNDSDPKIIKVGHLRNHPDNMEKDVFFVSDNGIGIPEKHREAVFKMFKRLHGRDAYGGGTGSGLSIVKKIIDRHRGRIWIETDKGGNKGTTFYFTLAP